MKQSAIGFLTGVIGCLMVWVLIQQHTVFAGEPDRPRADAPGSVAGVACPGDLNGDGQVDVFDLLIVLENWGDCPTEPAASCVDFCGEEAPAGCWCDENCASFGDCCDDVCEACDIGCPPDPDSCVGNCGDEAPAGCWCDENCAAFGDCCADVCEACDIGCPPDPDSCVGNCGEEAPGGCWCDDNCVSFGDCCSDYADVCG